jgi:hypothetical protein
VLELTSQPLRACARWDVVICRMKDFGESGASVHGTMAETPGLARSEFRGVRRRRMMRVAYVCFSSVALGFAVLTHDVAVTAGTAFAWIAALLAAAVGVSNERQERRLRRNSQSSGDGGQA